MRSAKLVRVAQPIACCEKVGRIGCGGQVAQRRVRSVLVVVVDPVRDLRLGVVETEEQALVEKLVAHAAVEAFAKAVLHRLSRRDEMPGDLVVLDPCEHRARCEFRSVVGDDRSRLAAALDERRQLARRAAPRK